MRLSCEGSSDRDRDRDRDRETERQRDRETETETETETDTETETETEAKKKSVQNTQESPVRGWPQKCSLVLAKTRDAAGAAIAAMQ